jgi:hypothetical protein
MKKLTNRPVITLLILLLGVTAVDVMANGPHGLWFGLGSGGGGTSGSGSGLEVTGTVGQPLVDRSSSGTTLVRSGFWYSVQGPVGSAGDVPPGLPAANRLDSPYPNPFNPATNIRFELTARSPVRVRIFDAQGRMVRDLVREVYPAGRHEVAWNGRDDQGGSVSSGVYFVRFEADGTVGTKKMTLLK